MSEQESALHTYQVEIHMIKPLKLKLQHVKPPDKDEVMEQFAQDIMDCKLDDNFTVSIKAKER